MWVWAVCECVWGGQRSRLGVSLMFWNRASHWTCSDRLQWLASELRGSTCVFPHMHTHYFSCTCAHTHTNTLSYMHICALAHVYTHHILLNKIHLWWWLLEFKNYFNIFKFLLLICMGVLFVCLSMYHVPGIYGGQKRSDRWLWLTMWVPGIEPRSSRRVDSALNHGAISLAP